MALKKNKKLIDPSEIYTEILEALYGVYTSELSPERKSEKILNILRVFSEVITIIGLEEDSNGE